MAVLIRSIAGVTDEVSTLS